MRTTTTLITTTAMALLLAGAATNSAAAAPPQATAAASFGEAEAWLERDPAHRGQRMLVYTPRAGAEAEVLATDLTPRGPVSEDELALGTDGHGRRVVVFTTRRGLSSVSVSGHRQRALRFSTGRDTQPSVLGGRVGFVRSRSRVMVAGLTRPTARTLARTSGDLQAFTDVAVGAGGSVAWVRYLESEAPRYRVELRRPGRATKRIYELRAGEVSDDSLAFGDPAPSGKQLTALQYRESGSRTVRFALPSGKRLK